MKYLQIFFCCLFILGSCDSPRQNKTKIISQKKNNSTMISFENSVELQEKLIEQYQIGGLISVSDYVNNYFVIGSTLVFNNNNNEGQSNFLIYDRKVELIDRDGSVMAKPILPLMNDVNYHKKIFVVKINDTRELFQLVLFY